MITVRRGLGAEQQVYDFTGQLRDILDLDWGHTIVLVAGQEVSPDYCVQPEDMVLVREFPAHAEAHNKTGLEWFADVFTFGLYGEIKYAVTKVGDDIEERKASNKTVAEPKTNPVVSGAKNQSAEGKTLPIIIGRHLFAPYMIGEPYMQIAGDYGKDLYWYATFLVGQSGLFIEQIRNGSVPIWTGSGNTAVNVEDYEFSLSGSPGNQLEIRQGMSFVNAIFNQKWVNSLSSAQQLVFGDDEGQFTGNHGLEIIEKSAQNPAAVEIELTFPDGLVAYNNSGNLTNATVALWLGVSSDGGTEWTRISISG
jgi:hypothetical protein